MVPAAVSVAVKLTNGPVLLEQQSSQSIRPISENVAGQSSPSVRPNNGNGEPDVSSLIQGRTSEHSSASLQERQVAQDVSTALVVDFGHYRSTHKIIAKHAGVSPETVKKWIAADSAPSLIYFLRLLPHSPSLRRLVSMESELSPDFQRELNSLIQRHMK